jgi:hypothetical protein
LWTAKSRFQHLVAGTAYFDAYALVRTGPLDPRLFSRQVSHRMEKFLWGVL